MTWRAWLIQALGGHVEDPNKPKELYFSRPKPIFMPLDRPFDPMDWERLARLPEREPVFFEWVGHRLHALDEAAKDFRNHPDHYRDRLVYLARRDEVLRTLHVSDEAGEKLLELFRKREKERRKAEQEEQNNG